MNYEGWVTRLAFLVDVTARLNNRNKELWCRNKLIAEFYDSIKAYKVKLRLQENPVKLYNLVHFPQLKSETLGILTMLSYCIFSFHRYLQDFKIHIYIYIEVVSYTYKYQKYLLWKSRSEVGTKVFNNFSY